MRAVTRSRVLVGLATPVAAVALSAVLAGCAHSDPYRDYTAPGAVPPAPSAAPGTTGDAPVSPPVQRVAAVGAPGGTAPAPAAPEAPAPPSPSAPAPVPTAQLRPMTQWERLYRQECDQGRVKNGCELFTDFALELEGINPETPNSASP